MVLIFDMDGVIVDNHQFHFDAFVEFGKRHGLTITRESFNPNFGRTNSEIMKSLFGEGITDAEIEILAQEKEEMYRQLYKPHIKPVSGLPEFLQQAASHKLPIALATSAPAENVHFTLTETGLRGYFSVITDASMVSHGKPDPEVYLLTAARLGVEPSECVVFEDSFSGIEAAQRAGMRVIGVATTYKPEALASNVKEIMLNFENAFSLLKLNSVLSNPVITGK